MYTIYYIRNTKTNHMYIGITSKPIHERMVNHRAGLRRGGHHNAAMQAAWNTDGSEVFVYGELVDVPPIPYAYREEQRWIDVYQTENPAYGYNTPKDRTGIKQRGFKGKGNAKLNEVAIEDIRQRRANGEALQSIASIYNIDQSAVSLIVRNLRWK